MKRSALLGLAGLVALGVAGCNTTTRLTGHSRGYSAAPRMPTYAIAVTVHGGLQPTPAQWAGIQARVAQELAWHGATLVTDLNLADRIIRVDFRPSEFDPENGGHITILGIKSNPYRNLAYRTNTGPYFPSYSFTGGFPYSSWWGASDYYSGHYYNYMGPWENGFTVIGPVAGVNKPTTPTTPNRPRHDTREICPPDALHPRSGYSSYAANDIPRSMSTGYASTSTPAYTSPQPRWNGERSAWRSEVLAANQPQRAMSSSSSRSASSSSWSSASRSERSYSRSDWSSSQSDSSYSRPSYTSPSYDSSYSSSSSSGSMSSGGYSSAPAYTSPSPSSDSSSSSSSGSMSSSPSSDSAR